MPPTQHQTNRQTQNVKVIVNAAQPVPPKRRPRKRRPAPEPEPVIPYQPPMAMSRLGIQPVAPRPCTYAPSSQMIIQDNAPPPPPYFERAQTNMEATIAQLHTNFQDELDNLRHELLAQQALSGRFKDIENVAQAVQTSFNSMLPSSSAMSTSHPQLSTSTSLSSPPPPSSMSTSSHHPMTSFSMHENSLFGESDDTVEGAWQPYVPHVPHHSSHGSHSPTRTHESGGGNDVQSDNLANVGIQQAAAVPLPSHTVSQPQQSPPITISSDTPQQSPPITVSSDARDRIYGSSASGSAPNNSHMTGGLPNENPHEQAQRLYSEYNAYRDARKRRHAGLRIRTLARSMGLQAGERERLDRIVRRIETAHHARNNPSSSSD